LLPASLRVSELFVFAGELPVDQKISRLHANHRFESFGGLAVKPEPALNQAEFQIEAGIEGILPEAFTQQRHGFLEPRLGQHGGTLLFEFRDGIQLRYRDPLLAFALLVVLKRSSSLPLVATANPKPDWWN
jgi:hypothetical protein